jgi:hypothetical protein
VTQERSSRPCGRCGMLSASAIPGLCMDSACKSRGCQCNLWVISLALGARVRFGSLSESGSIHHVHCMPASDNRPDCGRRLAAELVRGR